MSKNYDQNNHSHFELKANTFIIVLLGGKNHIYEILSNYDKSI